MKRALFLIMFLTALLGLSSLMWARVPITPVHQQSEGSDFSDGSGYRDYAAMDNPDYYYAAIKSAPAGVYYRQAGFNPARNKIVAQRQFSEGAITRREVVLMDADGSNEIYISPGDSGEGDIYGYMNPFWSDDGTVIGFAEVHNYPNPNKIIKYTLATALREYLYEPVGSDACNPDFVGNSTSTIVFWDWIVADDAADLFIWDGSTLTNITNSTLYSEYEPVSNNDGSVILYWSGETTTEPINTTHTLTYAGGSWIKDQGFSPIPDTYWSFWSGQDNNNIGVVVSSTGDVHVYDNTGTFLFDVTGPGYSGGSGQWNFIGFCYEGYNGELLLTSNAGRTEAGRDIIIATARNKVFVDDASGSDSNPGTIGAPFQTIGKGVSVAATGATVDIAAGTYAENVVVSRNMTLQGAGQDDTIISTSSGYVLQMAAGASAVNRSYVKDLQVTGGASGIVVGSYTTLVNVKATGNTYYGVNLNPLTDLVITDCSFNNNGAAGLKLASAASAYNITITGSHFDNNLQHGWYADASSAVEPDLDGVNISYTTFNNNPQKGFYTERLSNAVFDHVTVDNSGSTNYDWGAGIDINLKWKSYSNITIQNSEITDCGIGALNGVGVCIKARDDGTTYGANPASLNNVLLDNVQFNGNKNGLNFGEPGKDNVGPTSLSIQNCVFNNVVMDLNNFCQSSVDAATGNTFTGAADNYAIENRIYHKLDNALKGLVTWVVDNVFVTQNSGSIQRGINAASPNWTVNVAAGIYNEQITINKALTVTGADGAILDGTGLVPTWTTGVKIRSGNVTFDNIDIRNYTQDGLTAYDNIDMPNLHITNCKISNIQPGYWGFGIYVGYESEGWGYNPPDLTNHLDFTGLLISGNEITNVHSSALVVQAVTGTPGTLIVEDNYIHDCTTNSGIWIDCARNLIIRDNVLDNCKWGLEFTAYAEAWYTLDGPYSPKNITVIGNEIVNSVFDGVALYNGWPATISLEDNTIDGNTPGVHNYLSTALDASPNWWGDIDPSDDVSGNVTYDPWWIDADMTMLGSNLYVINQTQQEVFTTVQAAVDDAEDNNVIMVPGGVFLETGQINITNDIVLVGSPTRYPTVLKPTFNTTCGGNVPSEAFIYIAPEATVYMQYITIDCAGYNINHAIQSRGTLDIEDCEIMNVRWGHYNGRGIVFYGGDTGNLVYNVDFTNIERIGVHIRGNVMTPNPVVTVQDVTYTGKGVGDWLDYGVEFGGGGSGTVDNLHVSNCQGIASTDGSTSAGILVTDYWGTGTDANIINSDFDENSAAIAIGYGPADASTVSISGNTFNDNPIQVSSRGIERDLAALQSTNTWPGGYFLAGDVIYSSGAEMIYITAPKTLIKGDEEQTYIVKIHHVEDLRSFNIRIKVLKEDFAAPNTFTLGGDFATYGTPYLQSDEVTDNDYYIYDVTGGFLGVSLVGVTGDDVVAFTFSMTSLTNAMAPAPTGTLVDLPLAEVVLRDPLNAPILCVGTQGKLVYIDSQAPDPIVWVKCRTKEDSNNKIDLEWTNPTDAYKNHIWRLNYTALAGTTGYPTYNPRSFSVPAIPAVSTANGWIETVVDATQTYVDDSMGRGYYYYAVYVEDEAGNISGNPVSGLFYRESISYWPGDVDTALYPNEGNGTVTGSDIALLTANWGLTPGNNIIDVGPSTDYARRSRPCPDGRINIEDMMMFAMNYYNTDYEIYPRDVEIGEQPAVTVAADTQTSGNQLTVTLRLGENDNQVRGLNLPLSYGSGLVLQSVAVGDVWPETSLLLYSTDEHSVEISASVMGGNGVLAGNGTVATLVFAIVGEDRALQLHDLIARDADNRDIVISEIPGTVSNDDLVNVIPLASYLGKNFPNPFNPSTTVQYGLKESGSVRVSIFNNRGQLVRTLVNEAKVAGTYQSVWDGRDDSGQPASSGVYFIRMETRDYVKTNKALLLK